MIRDFDLDRGRAEPEIVDINLETLGVEPVFLIQVDGTVSYKIQPAHQASESEMPYLLVKYFATPNIWLCITDGRYLWGIVNSLVAERHYHIVGPGRCPTIKAIYEFMNDH